jgi:hypothetical protein
MVNQTNREYELLRELDDCAVVLASVEDVSTESLRTAKTLIQEGIDELKTLHPIRYATLAKIYQETLEVLA